MTRVNISQSSAFLWGALCVCHLGAMWCSVHGLLKMQIIHIHFPPYKVGQAGICMIGHGGGGGGGGRPS